MQINKIKLGAAVALLTASGVCCHNYIKDNSRANEIKQELKDDIVKHDGFPSIYDYNIAEYKEPVFKKADYWQVIADSLRNEIKKEQK